MLIFIDESGDLGFDFEQAGTSSHFVIAAVVFDDHLERRQLDNGVKRTLKNKINVGKSGKNPSSELKGTKTSIEVKRYFWRQIQDVNFSIYAVVLDKKAVRRPDNPNSDDFYNQLSRQLVDIIPIRGSEGIIHIEIDRSKGNRERARFNALLERHFEDKAPSTVNVRIIHANSNESKCIQAADMFAWGISRKFQQMARSEDLDWYRLFQSKIAVEYVILS